jgi:hypothetical protein
VSAEHALALIAIVGVVQILFAPYYIARAYRTGFRKGFASAKERIAADIRIRAEGYRQGRAESTQNMQQTERDPPPPAT